jgi:hypothetical protein
MMEEAIDFYEKGISVYSKEPKLYRYLHRISFSFRRNSGHIKALLGDWRGALEDYTMAAQLTKEYIDQKNKFSTTKRKNNYADETGDLGTQLAGEFYA